MDRVRAVLWMLWVPAVLPGQSAGAVAIPSYRAESIANLADGRAEELAPNSLVVVTGLNLSEGVSVRAPRIPGTQLPVSLPGTLVSVLVNNLPATIEYASPQAVVFIVPPNLRAGVVEIRVGRSSWYGPAAKKKLKAAAPALFGREDTWLLARHAGNGSWVDDALPARPGEAVVLYATGLGETNPPQVYRQVPLHEAGLAASYELLIRVNGVALEPAQVAYAGICPGYPGLYEIRITLPETVEEDPEVSLSLGGAESRTGQHLNLRYGSPQPAGGLPRLNQ